jgi:hypothetical protein
LFFWFQFFLAVFDSRVLTLTVASRPFSVLRSGMYQPEPTAFIQVPTGYGMGHGLPDYTFEQTPLGLSGGGGGGYGGGPGTAGAGSGGGAGTLIYTTPIFSASSSVVGPAPGPFQYHHSSSASSGTSSATTTTSPASSVLSHQQRLSPHSHSSTAVKMEQTHDDVHAQEAAARDYQPDLKVRTGSRPIHSVWNNLRAPMRNFSPSGCPSLTHFPLACRALLSARRRRAQLSPKSMLRPTQSTSKRRWYAPCSQNSPAFVRTNTVPGPPPNLLALPPHPRGRQLWLER